MPAKALKSPAVPAAVVPGWFGKLPSLGDFAARRLPRAFVHAWDEWLQQGLAAAHDVLGDGWIAGEGVAARRFWLGAGVLDESSWAGMLIPSADRVGRRFPLTVAARLPRHGSLASALAACAWYDAIEASVRHVVQARFAVDNLERELAQVAAAVPLALVPDNAAEQLADVVLQPMLQPELQSLTGANGAVGPLPCSVWWHDAARDAAEFSCFASLPPAAAFASLFGPTRSFSAGSV